MTRRHVVAALSHEQRTRRYLAQTGRPALTPRQRRRCEHKLGADAHHRRRVAYHAARADYTDPDTWR